MKSKSTTNTVKRIDFAIVKQFHIEAYDFDNIYPQRVLDIIGDSRTASSCMSRKQKFLFGGGFLNPKISKLIVNPFSDEKTLTADKLLRQSVHDAAIFNSVAWHLNFNGIGEVVGVKYIPWENIRYGDDLDEKYKGKIAVYDDWALCKKKKINAKDIKFYDQWNGSNQRVLDKVVISFTFV